MSVCKTWLTFIVCFKRINVKPFLAQVVKSPKFLLEVLLEKALVLNLSSFIFTCNASKRLQPVHAIFVAKERVVSAKMEKVTSTSLNQIKLCFSLTPFLSLSLSTVIELKPFQCSYKDEVENVSFTEFN